MKSAATIAVLASLMTANAARAQVSYVKDVRPILDRCCVECHRAGKTKGGVNLETYDAIRKDLGKLVVAGDPEKSELILAIEGRNDVKKMPPAKSKSQPTAADVKVLREWIKSGAKDDTPTMSLIEAEEKRGAGDAAKISKSI